MAEREELDIVTRLASEYKIITSSNAPAVEMTAMQFVNDFGQVLDGFYECEYDLAIEELIALDYWSNELAGNKKLSKNIRGLLKDCNKRFKSILKEVELDLNMFIKSC